MSDSIVGPFLFELRYYHGTRFIQRFHAYAGERRIVWDQAWPLFDLQRVYRQLAKAIKDQRVRAVASTESEARDG